MQTTKNLYKLLRLPKEASQEEIRQAHRKLVRKYHPDTNSEDPQAEERFKGFSKLTRFCPIPRSAESTTRGYALPLERGAPAEKAQELPEQTPAGRAQAVLAEGPEGQLLTT
jgi:hypothetical protein